MKKQIIRIGNSAGLRLDKSVLDTFDLSVGDWVEISVSNKGDLVITKKLGKDDN